MIDEQRPMIKDLTTTQQIKQEIQKAQRILIITHKNPDGDGLGSLSALAQYLQSINKDYQLFCRDELPQSDKFLPLLHQVAYEPEIFQQEFDLVIVIDSGSLGYAGVDDLLPQLQSKYTLINIDHHRTNDYFGQLNLVISDASSAAEIIYQLFRLWQVPITKDMATALLNGIVFDTGAFSNSGTTLSSLQAASHLLNLGARHKEVTEKKFRDKNLNLLKLWGRAFERLEYSHQYNLAYTILTLADFKEFNLEPEASNGLSNFFNELAGAKIIMVLTEQLDGTVKGSLRTTADDVDVSKLAQSWGGGGHQKAAGFSIKGNLRYENGSWRFYN